MPAGGSDAAVTPMEVKMTGDNFLNHEGARQCSPSGKEMIVNHFLNLEGISIPERRRKEFL